MKKILNIIRKAVLACEDWLYSLPVGKLLYCIFGLILAAFFNIVLGMKVCIVPTIFGGFIIMFIKARNGGRADWLGLLSAVVGGALIQILALL